MLSNSVAVSLRRKEVPTVSVVVRIRNIGRQHIHLPEENYSWSIQNIRWPDTIRNEGLRRMTNAEKVAVTIKRR